MSKSDEMVKSMMASMASQAVGIFLQSKEEQFKMNQEYQELLYSDEDPEEGYIEPRIEIMALSNAIDRQRKVITDLEKSRNSFREYYLKAVEEINSLKDVIELYQKVVSPEQLATMQKEKELNARTSNSKESKC